MDDLEYLADTDTKTRLVDYRPESRTVRQAVYLPPDITNDLLRAALENGYGSLPTFIADLCISVTLRWREAREWNQATDSREAR